MLRKVRETYGLTPAADFGPPKLKAIRQTLIAAGHSRVYINKLGADHPPHVQVGRGGGIIPAASRPPTTVEGG